MQQTGPAQYNSLGQQLRPGHGHGLKIVSASDPPNTLRGDAPDPFTKGQGKFNSRSELLAARKRANRATSKADVNGEAAITQTEYFFAQQRDAQNSKNGFSATASRGAAVNEAGNGFVFVHTGGPTGDLFHRVTQKEGQILSESLFGYVPLTDARLSTVQDTLRRTGISSATDEGYRSKTMTHELANTQRGSGVFVLKPSDLEKHPVAAHNEQMAQRNAEGTVVDFDRVSIKPHFRKELTSTGVQHLSTLRRLRRQDLHDGALLSAELRGEPAAGTVHPMPAEFAMIPGSRKGLTGGNDALTAPAARPFGGSHTLPALSQSLPLRRIQTAHGTPGTIASYRSPNTLSRSYSSMDARNPAASGSTAAAGGSGADRNNTLSWSGTFASATNTDRVPITEGRFVNTVDTNTLTIRPHTATADITENPITAHFEPNPAAFDEVTHKPRYKESPSTGTNTRSDMLQVRRKEKRELALPKEIRDELGTFPPEERRTIRGFEGYTNVAGADENALKHWSKSFLRPDPPFSRQELPEMGITPGIDFNDKPIDRFGGTSEPVLSTSVGIVPGVTRAQVHYPDGTIEAYGGYADGLGAGNLNNLTASGNGRTSGASVRANVSYEEELLLDTMDISVPRMKQTPNPEDPFRRHNDTSIQGSAITPFATYKQAPFALENVERNQAVDESYAQENRKTATTLGLLTRSQLINARKPRQNRTLTAGVPGFVDETSFSQSVFQSRRRPGTTPGGVEGFGRTSSLHSASANLSPQRPHTSHAQAPSQGPTQTLHNAQQLLGGSDAVEASILSGPTSITSARDKKDNLRSTVTFAPIPTSTTRDRHNEARDVTRQEPFHAASNQSVDPSLGNTSSSAANASQPMGSGGIGTVPGYMLESEAYAHLLPVDSQELRSFTIKPGALDESVRTHDAITRSSLVNLRKERNKVEALTIAGEDPYSLALPEIYTTPFTDHKSAIPSSLEASLRQEMHTTMPLGHNKTRTQWKKRVQTRNMEEALSFQPEQRLGIHNQPLPSHHENSTPQNQPWWRVEEQRAKLFLAKRPELVGPLDCLDVQKEAILNEDVDAPEKKYHYTVRNSIGVAAEKHLHHETNRISDMNDTFASLRSPVATKTSTETLEKSQKLLHNGFLDTTPLPEDVLKNREHSARVIAEQQDKRRGLQLPIDPGKQSPEVLEHSRFLNTQQSSKRVLPLQAIYRGASNLPEVPGGQFTREELIEFKRKADADKFTKSTIKHKADVFADLEERCDESGKQRRIDRADTLPLYSSFTSDKVYSPPPRSTLRRIENERQLPSSRGLKKDPYQTWSGLDSSNTESMGWHGDRGKDKSSDPLDVSGMSHALVQPAPQPASLADSIVRTVTPLMSRRKSSFHRSSSNATRTVPLTTGVRSSGLQLLKSPMMKHG